MESLGLLPEANNRKRILKGERKRLGADRSIKNSESLQLTARELEDTIAEELGKPAQPRAGGRPRNDSPLQLQVRRP